MGLEPHEYLEPFEFIRSQGIQILTPRVIPEMTLDKILHFEEGNGRDEWSALTMFNEKGNRIIVHNDSHSPVRQATTYSTK